MVSFMSRINISLMVVLKNEVKEHLLFLLLISSLSNFQIDFAFDSFPSNFCYCNMTLSSANGMGQFVFIVVHDMKLCLITVKRFYIFFFSYGFKNTSIYQGFARSNILIALFTNMRILKFKSQLTIAFFTAVNHLNGPLRKQNFTLTGSKGHGL